MDLKTLKEMPAWEWPENTDKALLKIIRNTKADPAERLLATEMAGDYAVVNDHLASALIEIVANGKESEELRAKAAIALGPALDAADTADFGEFDDSPISEDVFAVLKQALEKIYQEEKVPKLVRRRVLEAAVRAQVPWQLDAIRTAYASKDPDWQLTAVFCMTHAFGFEREILESLKSKDEDIYYEAVVAAGHEEVDEAWDEIRGLAVSPNTEKELRLAAIFSMAQIRPAEARPLLCELVEDKDEDISDAADEAILSSGDAHEFDEDASDDEEPLTDKPHKMWIN